MDRTKGHQKMTAGLDIGDKYSYPCASSISTAARLWRRVCSAYPSPEAFKRRFCSEQSPMRIAMEAGTHSPWASRVLEECAHEVLVANSRKLRLI